MLNIAANFPLKLSSAAHLLSYFECLWRGRKAPPVRLQRFEDSIYFFTFKAESITYHRFYRKNARQRGDFAKVCTFENSVLEQVHGFKSQPVSLVRLAETESVVKYQTKIRQPL